MRPLAESGGRRGRPFGTKGDKYKHRVKRGDLLVTPWGFTELKLSVPPGNTISYGIDTLFTEFDKGAKIAFDAIIKRWASAVFQKKVTSSIRNSMWLRSQQLQDKALVRPPTKSGGGGGTTWTIRTTTGGGAANKKSITLEHGREDSNSSGNYLVPLASWLAKSGLGGKDRNYATKAMLTRDLKQPGVFSPRETYMTDSGPARIIFLLNKEQQKKRRINGHNTTKRVAGQKHPRGKLKDVATAMYLAYSGYRGVYGAHKVDKERKTPRSTKSPLAADFGLTETTTAPKWHSRAAANSLVILYNAIMNVKIRQEASGKATSISGVGQDKDGKSFNIDNIRDPGQLSDDIIIAMERIGGEEG